jgi:hypothetical protein
MKRDQEQGSCDDPHVVEDFAEEVELETKAEDEISDHRRGDEAYTFGGDDDASVADDEASMDGEFVPTHIFHNLHVKRILLAGISERAVATALVSITNSDQPSSSNNPCGSHPLSAAASSGNTTSPSSRAFDQLMMEHKQATRHEGNNRGEMFDELS